MTWQKSFNVWNLWTFLIFIMKGRTMVLVGMDYRPHSRTSFVQV
ncbi:hypothetical protein [Methanolobus psychrotolerans]|nr:hypothetical protein [Methanolobus psychrotolerans]